MSTGLETQERIDPVTLEFRRAFQDESQVWGAYETLKKANDDRTKKNAKIQGKLNHEQPWSQADLDAANQNWRNNRATGFLPTMVSRIVPPLIRFINSTPVLTLSKLDATDPESTQKSETFRTTITRTIRRHERWDDMLNDITGENVVFGYASVGYTDEEAWFPQFFRQDDAYFPDECPQEASLVPLFALRQRFYIHELAQNLINPAVSQAAGWIPEALVESINKAKPDDSRQNSTPDNERRYEDTVRASTIGASYQAGVNVVKGAHILVKELTGKVSHYIIDEDSKKLLFVRHDRFESMRDCLSNFAVQHGLLHASMGAGRVLYNTHVSIEQSRNLIADNLYLAGMLILKGTTAGMTEAAITVTHPVAVVDPKFEVESSTFRVNYEAFQALDRHFSQLAELQVGAFMPAQLYDNTNQRVAAYVKYVQEIEIELRNAFMERFERQIQRMVWMIQRKICRDSNIQMARDIYAKEVQSQARGIRASMARFISRILGKEAQGPQVDDNDPNYDAIMACVDMMRDGLEPEEIFELANCNPREAAQDDAVRLAPAIDEVAKQYIGNPSIRQTALMNEHISSKLGYNKAKELIIPEEDNTITSEQTRLQLIEMQTLLIGEKIPLSQRDDDMIHMNVIIQKSGHLMESLKEAGFTEESLGVMSNVLDHFDEHLAAAQGKGTQKDRLAEQMAFSAQAHGELQAAMQAVKGLPQSGLMAGGMPAAAAGMPPVR